MTSEKAFLDLIVVVPDADMEATVRALLARPAALGMHLITFDVRRHVQRDAGCRSDCHNYLRLWLPTSRYALVLFDHEGSGRDSVRREEVEAAVESVLRANGWADRSAAVVIAPELESWVWSDSPVVDEVLGWRGRDPGLRSWLQAGTAFWPGKRPKPTRPKEALEAALRTVGKQRSPVVYGDLASLAPVAQCVDPSFLKFRDTLRTWFPLPEGDQPRVD